MTRKAFRIVNHWRTCSYSPHDYQKYRHASARDLSHRGGNPHPDWTWHRNYNRRAGAAGRNFYFDWALGSTGLHEQFQHLLREFRPDAAFFVLEIDESVFPIRFLVAQRILPNVRRQSFDNLRGGAGGTRNRP